MGFLDRTFRIGERGSTIGWEVLGGVTTFMALSYIIFVQPAMMHDAGIPIGGAFIGTCIASALACILMALTANYPIALAAVFIGGCVFVALSVFGFRAKLMEFIPDSLNWEDATEFLPAFLTVVVTPLTGSITDGIAFGFISYSALKLATGRRREVHWAFHAISLALIVRYVLVPPGA